MPPKSAKTNSRTRGQSQTPVIEFLAPEATSAQATASGDQRLLIEKNKYKYTGPSGDEVPLQALDGLTPDEIQEAADLIRKRKATQKVVEPENSGETRHTRISVFQRMEKDKDKEKEAEKADSQDARDQIKRKEMRERIRKEEEAKLEKQIQKRIREEEC